MPVCVYCTDLSALHHRMALADLLRGISQGCKACFLLRQAIRQMPSTEQEATHLEWIVDRSMHITLFDNEQQLEDATEVYVGAGSSCFSKAIGPGRSVLEPGWTQAHQRLTQQWLSDCSSHHRICPPAELQSLPTRVVDVGDSENSLRLHISNGALGRYVALSHSWGGHKPIETTKATLQDHCESIKLDASSKTFSDAAQVCRDLGFQYLWIDSLCIVQDDGEDWATEAGKMSHVYRNAALTISAEGAADAREGLYPVQPAACQSQTQVELQYEVSSGQLEKVFVRTRRPGFPKSRIVTNFAHASVSVSESRLASRAWVLQERLLSPRILHFYKEELAWSCCSVSRCECRLDARQTDMSVFKKLQTPGLPRAKLSKELHRHWTDLVVEFTNRKLTKMRDRLPAMSGLAGVCNEITGSKYCAGLFLEDLAYGLLWISDHEGSGAPIIRNDESPDLPSWSWASITGPVKYLDRQRSQFERKSRGNTVIPTLHVIGAHVEPRGPNAFGDVYYGWVCVKAQLLRVTFDENICYPWDSKLRALLRNRGSRKSPAVIPDHLSPSASIDKNNTYLLRAGKFILGGMWSSNASENICLMLEKVNRPGYLDAPLFRRCGFVLNAFPSDLVWAEQFAPTTYVFLV
ncbi:heterokaryon incompatibility protein-domain-containing protein [Boeremia exigua]|uniref:heterokaryon incompatibility protein-domain-containing protein n=1 Tax=Boeremia exigua TaxID=749465 RepID=UPI001E8CF781|nr:heterokaryon incompatibility protein-domain-containing protein [Boeremia exigua]KAH6644450.1 heterokaryon incompatibility protein-domain-containing protein [Boeremia exigua]